MKKARMGRPLKYKHFIAALDDQTIHTPATIVQHGIKQGFFSPPLEGKSFDEARLRVRHTLARFSSNHQFPFQGDGFAFIQGQPPIRGWHGWRWKLAADVAPALNQNQG